MRQLISKIWIITAALGLLTSSGYGQNNEANGTISVSGKKENEYPSLAKISMVEAIETAQKAVAGKAIEAELDDERDFLVYEVKIAADDGSIQKVTVDAGEKRVLRQKRD